MRDNALYFPFINVPRSIWFFRILLYWDKVSSIVPLEIYREQYHLEPHMRGLLNEGLVEPLYPSQFLWRHQELFSQIFLDYVETRLRRSNRFEQSKDSRFERIHLEKMGSRVHMEKLDTLADELVMMGVAKRIDYSWYSLEPWVASAYMTYLATYLGSLDNVNATPVTQDIDSLDALTQQLPQTRQTSSRRRVLPVRQVLLGRLLPVPVGSMELREVLSFKERYGLQLRVFRNEIETACISIANTDDDELREERLEREITRLETEKNALADEIRTGGTQITFGTLLTTVSAVASIAALDNMDPPWRLGAGALAGATALGAAVYQAISATQQRNEQLKQPLAYAAFAQRQFGA